MNKQEILEAIKILNDSKESFDKMQTLFVLLSSLINKVSDDGIVTISDNELCENDIFIRRDSTNGTTELKVVSK